MALTLKDIWPIDYEKIFLIENLGNCQTNGVRREDLAEALELERLQEQNYRDLGYEVVRIAPASVDERAREILRYVEMTPEGETRGGKIKK